MSNTSLEQAAADAEDKLLTMAIEKYSSPYGKANPETYAYKQGLIDGIGTPVNSIHCKRPNCQQDFDISPPVGTVIAGANYTGQSGCRKLVEALEIIKKESKEPVQTSMRYIHNVAKSALVSNVPIPVQSSSASYPVEGMEKVLFDFFMWFRNKGGEENIGKSVEKIIEEYLKLK